MTSLPKKIFNPPLRAPGRPRDLTPLAKVPVFGADITVVIPCHNYARFLAACLNSVRASVVKPTRIIVIDDASDDAPHSVVDRCYADKELIEFHRVEFRDVHQVRRFGLSLVDTKYVLFLDADNLLHPGYLQDCIERLEADRNAAFCYPVLMAFDGASGPMHGTHLAPDIVRAADIEAFNRCDANSVFRAEVLRSSLGLETVCVLQTPSQDWAMIRAVLRAGAWHGVKSAIPMLYRVHADQMTAAAKVKNLSYFVDANLQNEVVTIVVAFSGRWSAWQELRRWLMLQEWPQEQTRLLVLNSTHDFLTAYELGLQDCRFRSVQIERIDNGVPGLSDQNRAGDHNLGTRQAVEAAVAGLYNRAAQMAYGEYLLFVEDDVIPQQLDTVEKLLRLMGSNIAAVSGAYRHRYHDALVAFELPWSGKLFSFDGNAVEQVGGTGFGCCVVRRSLLLQFPLSGDSAMQPHYDVDFASRVRQAKWRWLLNREVQCDHRTDAVFSERLEL